MVTVHGSPPTPERKREYRQGHAVGQFQQAAHEAKKARQERNATRSMQHHGPFHCAHGVLRNPNGTFAKETAPTHKRLKRIPWEKEGRNWKRRQAKKRS